MDYDLTRIDYIISGVTYPDTLKILAATDGHKIQQKFVIGDKNGVLQCLSIKDEEPVVQFKTLPGKPMTSVQLASTMGTQAEKIFAASGNEVKGYTRKGKVFLTIETSLTETITAMYILEADLVLCSGRSVTHYRDLREFHSYICEDRVLDIAAFAAPNNTRVRLLALIANKGAAILEGGQFVTRTAISSGPSRLAVPPLHYSHINVFYGSADGSIGLVSFEESVLSSKCLVEGRGLGSVVCVGWFYGNGGTHLAVGRHDGSIQLYLVDMQNLADKPRLKFTYFCGEPVTSVTGGCVGTEENELLAATFSGRIFALRSRRLVSGGGALANIPQDALATRRTKLKSEVARLEKQTASERDKYQLSTRSIIAGLSTPPLLDVQYELSGATHEGWQEAKIISEVPLDMLFVYCNRKLNLQTDSAAVLSLCPSQGTAADLLATIRCQAGTRRLWVRVRHALDSSAIRRAESVRVLIYALPTGAPRVARLITLRLPALPYYSEHEDPDSDKDKKRSWCQIQMSGSFSVAEMTSWLTEALPGDLPRPAASVTFGRCHTLLRTALICEYQRGSAVFKSDNISTAAVIRDIISNCSVENNIRVEMSCDIPSDCCVNAFKKIQKLFELQYQKSRDIALKKAIGALDLDTIIMNEDTPVLCQDYFRVLGPSLASADDTENETHFDELIDTIEQWYTDGCALSLHVRDVKNERTQLVEALRDCQLEEIIKILSNAPLSPQEFY